MKTILSKGVVFFSNYLFQLIYIADPLIMCNTTSTHSRTPSNPANDIPYGCPVNANNNTV